MPREKHDNRGWEAVAKLKGVVNTQELTLFGTSMLQTSDVQFEQKDQAFDPFFFKPVRYGCSRDDINGLSSATFSEYIHPTYIPIAATS